jgi:hypothetical protein
MEQKTESKIHDYRHSFLTKAEKTYIREKKVSSIKGARRTRYLYVEEKN